MTWTTPAFEEIKMDAEARGYPSWVDDADPLATFKVSVKPQSEVVASPDTSPRD